MIPTPTDEESKNAGKQRKKSQEENPSNPIAASEVEIFKEAEKKSFNQLRQLVLEHLAKRAKDEATELLVEGFKEKNKIFTIRNSEREEIFIYEKTGTYEGVYREAGETYIREYCRTILGDAYTINLVHRVVSKIATDTYIDAKDFFNNSNADEVAVQNGILNIITKELNPFNPEKIFFNKLPVVFIPEKDCPKIKKYLSEVMKNGKDDLPIAQELFGFVLRKKNEIHKALMLVGVGRNGKSV